MRVWLVKSPVETFYLLKEPFKIDDCIFEKEEDHMVVSVTIEADEESQVKALALKKIKNTCLALSMAVNDLFEFDDFLSDIEEITPARSRRRMIKSFMADAIIVVDHLKPDAKEEAKCIHKLLEKADNYAIRAADYFQKGLTLRRWRQDAFLNFYKANELIFEYFGEADASELERKFDKPKGELTTKEKMKYMCEKLSIEQKLLEKVDNIVDIRSSQDVAHAKLTEPEMNQEDIDACREMAKQTILNYLLTLQNTDGT